MKSMSRRNYLIRMGTGAAGVVGAAGLDILAQKRNKPARTNQIATVDASKWPITNSPPSPDSFVTAIIWGLSGIWYRKPIFGSPSLEVGFHTGHSSHRHQLNVRIYITTGGGCEPGPQVNLPARINSITLRAVGGSAPNAFQTSGPFRRDQPSSLEGDMDIRWMPDLDRFPFYPEVYSKNAYPGHRLSIMNGTLYTRVKTQSTFSLVDVDQPNSNGLDYGPMALYMATAIEGTSASLQINGMSPIPLPKNGDTKYQIVFRNECDDCQLPDQSSTDETRWNDFHHNRKIVRLPNKRTKYGLRVKTPVRPGAQPNFCYEGLKILQNDEAPCSATGFGGPDS
jgi:hypothetical protein